MAPARQDKMKKIYFFLLVACGIAVSLLVFRVVAAQPEYELSQAVSVNAAGETIQLPAGQTVTIIGGINGSGQVMIRVVLPNGSVTIAQIPAASIRQKAAGAAATPPAAATPQTATATPPPAATPATVAETPPPAATPATTAAMPPPAQRPRQLRQHPDPQRQQLLLRQRPRPQRRQSRLRSQRAPPRQALSPRALSTPVQAISGRMCSSLIRQ